MKINLQKLLKRDWNWYQGSGEQKELYIKTLQRVLVEQDKRIAELEDKLKINK